MEGIERIKILASEIKDKPLLKIIEYLLTREDMNEKYLNEEKSLKQMVEFIKNNAKKQAQNGIAMIEDETVYSWAIHYFDETNKDLELSKEDKQDTKKEEIKKPTVKKENKWIAEGQLSLFDVCM